MRDDASIGRIVLRAVEYSEDKRSLHSRVVRFFGFIVGTLAIANLLPTLRRDEMAFA
jgi:hypothetical protein